MRNAAKWIAPAVLTSVLSASATAAPIELEIAATRGLQPTAQHEWLQLLTGLGIDNVRLRTARSGDEPRLTNRGTTERPNYHVLGILTARDELLLPGGKFTRRDRGRLHDYLERAAADGSQGVTAPRGRFDLTERQFTAIHADLARPLGVETKGRPPGEVVAHLGGVFAHQLVPDAAAQRTLNSAQPIEDEYRSLTAGTGLAMLLRQYGLALRPEKPRGQPVALRIERLVAAESTEHVDTWPVGWPSEASPRELAPAMFEFLSVEIEGYSLAEALAAIQPRVEVPFYFDHAALARHEIDPANVDVRLPRTRTFHKRLIDRILFQARLHGELRTDEAGTVFLWITR